MSFDNVHLADIDFDHSPMVRAEMRDETVEEYADAYRAKSKFPPPILFLPNGRKHYLIADGRYRLEALRRFVKAKVVLCDVRQGSDEEALKFALSCNIKHGLRRTNADKRHCVELAVMKWPDKTLREIAEMCCVSQTFVHELRKESLLGDEPQKSPSVDTQPLTKTESVNVYTGNATREEKKDGLSTEKPSPSPAPTAAVAALKPKVQHDSTGCIIPPKIMKYWERNQEVQDLMTTISRLKGVVDKAKEGDDLMFAEVARTGDYQRVCIALGTAYDCLKACRSYAVCTTCQGHPEMQPKGSCPLCYGKGFISEHRWDRLVPKEIKAIRAKVAASREK